MRNESQLWKKLRVHWKPAFDYVERCETRSADGRPDVDLLWNRSYCPIELKQKFKSETPILVPMRKEQVFWWEKWTLAGGRGLIIFGVNCDQIALIDGCHARALRNKDFFWQQFAIGFCSVFDGNEINRIIKNYILREPSGHISYEPQELEDGP